MPTAKANQRNKKPATKNGAKKKKGPTRKKKAKQPAKGSCCLLSPCARDYALALGDPFNGPLACIPLYPALPSERMRCWVKTGIETGSGAYGFISMNPFRMIANDAANPAVRFSGSAWAGNSIAATGAAGTFNANSNSRWAVADVGSSSTTIQYRLVSAGLRVKYVGTVLARGGTYFGLLQPNHENIQAYTASDFLRYEEASYDSVNSAKDGWFTLTYRPVDETDCEWQKSTATGPCAEDMIMGVLIAAPSTTPTSYIIEAFANFEIVGAPARAKVPSYADSNGFSAVFTATGMSEYVLKAAYAGARGFGDAVLNRAQVVLQNILSGVGNNAVDAATSALISYGMSRGRGRITAAPTDAH